MTRQGKFAAAGLSAFFLAIASSQAADWPGFRGPTGSGVTTETDFPIEWTKENLLWKFALPGPGASSPIVVKDKVFVTSYAGYHSKVFAKDVDKGPIPKSFGDPAKLQRIVLCVDGVKGALLWQKEIPARLPEEPVSEMIREHGYATNTPVSDGAHVYFFLGKTGVFAFDLEGKQLWQSDVGTGTSIYGSAASLVLCGNLIIVNASVEAKALLALDKETGHEVWRHKDIAPTWGTPIVVKTPAGADEIVLSQPGKVAGFDPANGKELWHCQGLPNPDVGGIYNTPIARECIVYAVGGGAPGQPAIGVAVLSGGRGDVTRTHVLWRVKAGSTVNSPIIVGDFVYFVDVGIMTCLRADTGKVVYKERFYETPREFPSPVVAGDKIFMQTRFDGLFVVATGGEFRLLAQNQVAEDDHTIFNASPALSNGRIYLRSNMNLYCVGRK